MSSEVSKPAYFSLRWPAAWRQRFAFCEEVLHLGKSSFVRMAIAEAMTLERLPPRRIPPRDEEMEGGDFLLRMTLGLREKLHRVANRDEMSASEFVRAAVEMKFREVEERFGKKR